MALRSATNLMASAAILLCITEIGIARPSQELRQSNATQMSGIVTDRLSRAHLALWKSIVDIIVARDKAGRHLHPTLHALWQQAEMSGHLIHIELSEEASQSRAGQFSIEMLDPNGGRHVAVIRLNLATIRQTYVGEDARRADGLIPFLGLGTKQRYAEVLGHELAHAVKAFQDVEYLQLYQQFKRAAGDLDMTNDDDGAKRLETVKELMREIEKPAEAAESEIWRELKNHANHSPTPNRPR